MKLPRELWREILEEKTRRAEKFQVCFYCGESSVVRKFPTFHGCQKCFRAMERVSEEVEKMIRGLGVERYCCRECGDLVLKKGSRHYCDSKGFYY